MTDERDWLDPVVERALDKEIDRLAKGREDIVKPRSRELLAALVHNVVLNVLTEITDPNNWTGEKFELVQLEDDPIVCRSCGRVGAHVREKRDEGTFIVCKCGEDLEQVDD